MSKWTKTSADIAHYTKVVRELLTSMTNLPLYLSVTLRNRSTTRGWLEGAKQGNNASQTTTPFTRSWYGSLTLQDGVRDVEIDYLVVESIHPAPPPP
jgi:hypothetical protein